MSVGVVSAFAIIVVVMRCSVCRREGVTVCSMTSRTFASAADASFSVPLIDVAHVRVLLSRASCKGTCSMRGSVDMKLAGYAECRSVVGSLTPHPPWAAVVKKRK